MAGVNKVILVARLGKEPETRYAQNGTAVCNFSVATSETWNDKNTGDKKEKTEWHRIVTFGNLAEICSKYLHKGKQVYIEGKLQTRQWQDKNGVDHYTTEIVANNMVMLSPKSSGNQQQQPQQSNQQSYQQHQIPDDDIPF